jgi:hypothetical protein
MVPKAPNVAVDTPKTPEQIRQEKLAAATQSAQGQMNPMNKLPADQFAKSASNVRQQQQAVATQNAQGEMLPVSTLPTDQFNKSATNVRQRKQSNATKSVRKPKDNTITMPKRNVKPRNAGKNAFGQMTQNLGKVAEGNRFDKLNYIFESILAEQDPAQGSTKQTISQYITNFFKQFMKGINISDPSVTTQVASLAKELEQNYAKDKGKTTLPKLANLGWSVSHAQAEENPQQSQTTQPSTTTPSTTTSASSTSTTTPQAAQASNQKAKTAYQQIQSLLKGLTPANKQKILASLQKELVPPVEKDPTISVGKQKRNKKAVDPADAQLLAAAKKQGKI